MLKITPSAVGMYEQGRREPSLGILIQMSEIFGVSLDFLATGKAATPQEYNQINQLLTQRIAITDQRLDNRRVRPFSREELVVLFAAMLIEP